MISVRAIAFVIALTVPMIAEERVDKAILEIFGDHMKGQKVPTKRVHSAMEEIVFENYSVKGDLKAAIAEVKRQHPKLFISFGASEALNQKLPTVQFSEKKMNLKSLMDRLAKEGNCRWEFTIGKGLLLCFTKANEKDVGVRIGL